MVDLVDFFLEGFKKVVEWVTDQFLGGLESGYDELAGRMFGTPVPDTDTGFVFGTPTNSPWPALRDALVGGEITMLALLLLMMAVQGRHLLQIWGSWRSRRNETDLVQEPSSNAWQGAVLIATWYWVASLLLFMVEGFTLALLPGFEAISRAMLGFLAVSLANPVLALLFAVVGGLAMVVMEALFFIRDAFLILYLYTMPLLVALAFSGLPVISRIAMGFVRSFVPLAILPLPAAILFKGYDFLFAQGAFAPGTAFQKYLVAVSLPIFALYVTWKTFKYASPLTAKVIGGTAKGAAVVGTIAAGSYLAGPQVGATAARWGPRAAAGHAVAQHTTSNSHDNLANHQTTPAAYRRTENDPSP